MSSENENYGEITQSKALALIQTQGILDEDSTYALRVWHVPKPIDPPLIEVYQLADGRLITLHGFDKNATDMLNVSQATLYDSRKAYETRYPVIDISEPEDEHNTYNLPDGVEAISRIHAQAMLQIYGIRDGYLTNLAIQRDLELSIPMFFRDVFQVADGKILKAMVRYTPNNKPMVDGAPGFLYDSRELFVELHTAPLEIPTWDSVPHSEELPDETETTDLDEADLDIMETASDTTLLESLTVCKEGFEAAIAYLLHLESVIEQNDLESYESLLARDFTIERIPGETQTRRQHLWEFLKPDAYLRELVPIIPEPNLTSRLEEIRVGKYEVHFVLAEPHYEARCLRHFVWRKIGLNWLLQSISSEMQSYTDGRTRNLPERQADAPTSTGLPQDRVLPFLLED